jgi:hypothetical protein
LNTAAQVAIVAHVEITDKRRRVLIIGCVIAIFTGCLNIFTALVTEINLYKVLAFYEDPHVESGGAVASTVVYFHNKIYWGMAACISCFVIAALLIFAIRRPPSSN